ncbi:MAG: zinc-binding metallopeptidase family protein [Alphaproteobacteria bacterium]
MRRFLCPNCNNQIHFDNNQCVSCGSVLGYRPLQDQFVLLNGEFGEAGSAPLPCVNRDLINCNWLCEHGAQSKLCLSCLHTRKIPDTSDNEKRRRWGRLERAKRRLFYALIKFDLPLAVERDNSEGSLHFELLGNESHPNGNEKRVMTGHYNGRITINIDEADDAIREKNRTALGEPYRALIGHFRHEVAHYYWDRLIAGKDVISACRACFGDERQDYSQALKAYYTNGPGPDWQQSYVSAYASAHPWEDFAETWAHYFHIVGGLETARAYGLNPQPLHPGAPVLAQLEDPYHVSDHLQLIQHWIPLTVAMNAMNRSMGISDYYPFVLSPQISEKLKFVHDLIVVQQQSVKVAPFSAK